MKHANGPTLRQAAGCYLLSSAVLHLVWEFSHMPLYVVWQTGSARQILFNGFHCTIGDVMIATATLAIAVFTLGNGRWPQDRWVPVSAITIVSGVGYTVFSEWYNTSITEAWTYSELMPLFPATSIGVSPIAQWIIIPISALTITYWRSRPGVTDRTTNSIPAPERVRDEWA
jgi:hypothetical protein